MSSTRLMLASVPAGRRWLLLSLLVVVASVRRQAEQGGVEEGEGEGVPVIDAGTALAAVAESQAGTNEHHAVAGKEDGAAAMVSRAKRPHAIASIICDDSWLPALLTLGASVRKHGTSADLIAMLSEGVSPEAHAPLREVFDKVMVETPIRQHPSITRTGGDCVTLKLRLWQLPYEKVLFMDADMVALASQDSLLEQYGELSAKVDRGFDGLTARGFNSGLMVIAPSPSTFAYLHEGLVSIAKIPGPGGDQNFLNFVFPRCEEKRGSSYHAYKPEGLSACWSEELAPEHNIFARDLAEEHLESIRVSLLQGSSSVSLASTPARASGAAAVASVHFSGDWGAASVKPWGRDCMVDSKSLSVAERHKSVLAIWLKVYKEALPFVQGHGKVSDALFGIQCEAVVEV